MRKIMVSVLSLVLVVGVIVPTASAQGRYYDRRSYSTYRRNNTVKKVAIGTAAGAVLGGLIGGRKGVAIGGIAGAGGGYIWSRRNRGYNHRYYNNNQRPYYGNQQSSYNTYAPRH